VTMEHALANVVLTTALASLFVWLYWEYRTYRVERTRFKLFGLRDELFALGRGGALPFETPAYGMLRMMLNGAIRFSHRANLLAVLVFRVTVQRSDAFSARLQRQTESWTRALESLDPEMRRQVDEIHRRYVQTMIEQTMLSSLVLATLALPFVLLVGLARLSGALARRLAPRVGPGLDCITTSEAESESDWTPATCT